MKSNISIVTLAVQNLETSTFFYQHGLKFPLSKHSNDAISFFNLEGSWLALYPRDKLAEDIGIDASGSGFSGITLAHNLASPELVDAFVQQAISAGATLMKAPAHTFWGGYSAYFKDLDEHLWEIAWNPHFKSDGNS